MSFYMKCTQCEGTAEFIQFGSSSREMYVTCGHHYVHGMPWSAAFYRASLLSGLSRLLTDPALRATIHPDDVTAVARLIRLVGP